MLVKADKFIFVVDFVVLDMEEDLELPLILGRPFLAIGGALINVQSGKLTFWANRDEVKFNIYRSMELHDEKPTCCQFDSIGHYVVKTHMGCNVKVPLGSCPSLLRTDGSQSTNEGIKHNLYTLKIRHKESPASTC